ncbi:Cytochrome P450, E-class, group I [Trema orientale]|uniref:Cytochrome P450, E-class, group I n=1 Tax=Trema orientale TaxID=63057 RepID=A0A2P5BFP9_TREOI|nr:Cytochrome P450, E-class, group I [Trema orientale]
MALENIGYVEILAGAIVIYFLIVVHQWHHWRVRKAITRTWPVIGMLPGLFHNISRLHDFATEILKKSRGTLEFKGPWFADLDFIITCDPSNIQHILNTNFANYPKGEEFREVFDVLGDGILNVDSDLWRLQRKMFQLWSRRHKNYVSFIARTIQRKMMDELIPFLDRVSETGLDQVNLNRDYYVASNDGVVLLTQQVDLQEAFQRMITFDNAILLIFGINPASHSFKLSKVEYQKAFEDIQQAVFLRHVLPQSCWKLQRWLQIGGEGKLMKARKIFDEFMFRCISIKQEELSRNKSENEEDQDSFGMLTIYMEEKENPYAIKFLKDVALNFVGAARDTLTASLTWFFWLVATHPNVETKILEEIKERLPANMLDHGGYCGGSFGAEELNKLIYLQAALHETFRLYPPIPFNHRTADKVDTLPSGHHVKEKTRVLLSLYSTGRMEEIWGGDCYEFKPERWISEQGGFVYVPFHKYPMFNGGPRTCLGKDMTLVQMKIVAITLLRSYCFQVVEGHPISPDLTVTLYMKHGLKIQLRLEIITRRWTSISDRSASRRATPPAPSQLRAWLGIVAREEQPRGGLDTSPFSAKLTRPPVDFPTTTSAYPSLGRAPPSCSCRKAPPFTGVGEFL